jgi:DNA modification methylase
MDRGEGWDCFSPDEYLPLLREWVQEWSRVLRPGGAVLAFCDQARISHLWDFCRAAGLKPKRVLTWVKTNPPPAGLIRRNLISATEFLVWAVKPGARYTFNRVEGWDRRNVIETPVITRMERVGHPTQKPLGVLSPLIALTTDPGDLVLDPFAGSGSAGVAALRLGRRCHLIERHRAYFALLKKRLEREEDGSTQDISSTGQDGEGDL